MRRAVIFRYDDVLREVRAVGLHGVDPRHFAKAQVTVESAPIAIRALEQDRVVEAHGDISGEVPPAYAALVDGCDLFCTPMVAAGRPIGVILSDREAGAPTLVQGERSLLWIFGKLAALAALAGTGARQSERARLLERRMDLARELHDRVVQRLFGVSLALSSRAELDHEARERCAQELTDAASELRSLVQRSDAGPMRQVQRTLTEEVARLQREHPDLRIVAATDSIETPPPGLEQLVQSVLAEAVRNAHKHAAPTRVLVRAHRTAGTFAVEIENDGVQDGRPGAVAGMGLRLAAFDALEHGGFVEFGPLPEDAWRVRLVLPDPATAGGG